MNKETLAVFKITFKQQVILTWLGVFLSLIIVPSYANDFSNCIALIKTKAKKHEYSDFIVNDVIDNLTPIERVIELDKSQPEFKESFITYVNRRVTKDRIKTGQILLAKHKTLFSSLFEQYGIPPEYLIAFWGLETNFGRHKGKMSVLNSLATLACDQRRSEFFTNELFDLFHLIDTKKVTVSQLQGSWAGAMGHMQFMPSAFRKYAVDGDKDGKVDIWQSEVDALTTAANYLQHIGWQKNVRWGREIVIPEDFNFQQVEFDRYYPLSLFSQLGVKKTNGNPLPIYDIEAELFFPSGHKGPAFLLYKNFNVIMTWNLSKNYALSVGLLANRIKGAQGIAFKGNAEQNVYSFQQLQLLQYKLNEIGLDVGEPDGVWGPNTRKAIREFQLKNNLTADGFPNQEVLRSAGVL